MLQLPYCCDGPYQIYYWSLSGPYLALVQVPGSHVALQPQWGYRLLGMGNPGCPPLLSHSSWALKTLEVEITIILPLTETECFGSVPTYSIASGSLFDLSKWPDVPCTSSSSSGECPVSALWRFNCDILWSLTLTFCFCSASGSRSRGWEDHVQTWHDTPTVWWTVSEFSNST